MPAATFQYHLQASYQTLPRAAWVEHAGPRRDVFAPEGSGDRVRESNGGQPEIRCRPEATVLTFPMSGVEDAFQVLVQATAGGRAWASGGFIDRSERALVLPPWRDDGSDPDPDALALMVSECGQLQRGTDLVVTDHRPRVVDFHTVTWMAHASSRERAVKPWLLLDVDGVLLPYGTTTDMISTSLLRELDLLAQSYDLAWATSWGASANTLLRETGRSPWPVVHGLPRLGGDPDGYDTPRVAPGVGLRRRPAFRVGRGPAEPSRRRGAGSRPRVLAVTPEPATWP